MPMRSASAACRIGPTRATWERVRASAGVRPRPAAPVRRSNSARNRRAVSAIRKPIVSGLYRAGICKESLLSIFLTIKGKAGQSCRCMAALPPCRVAVPGALRIGGPMPKSGRSSRESSAPPSLSVLPEVFMPVAAPDLARHPLTRWTGPLGLPDFSAIADGDFAPVFDAALAAHEAEVAAIAENPQAPTIGNTLEALELAGEALDRVSAIFWCRAGAHTNKDIQALEREIAPKMSRHFSAIHMNAALFARIDALYQAREALGLDAETVRVLEKTWKRFVKAGAKLDEAGKARLAAINERLASLGAAFGQNVLADEAGWVLYLDAGDDLAGLPAFLTDAMAEAAAARGEAGRYAVTLSRSIVEPFLSFSTRRDLREKVFAAFTKRGENGGETDNGAVVKETLALRAEKARLLGYDSFAALKLDDTMAKTPAAVLGLLEPVWEKARAKAGADRAELQRLATQAGDNA